MSKTLKKGCLMTSENGQKCFEGTKTLTRRLIKPQPPGEGYQIARCMSTTGPRKNVGKLHWVKVGRDGYTILDSGEEYFKPKYQPGDIVAIKETHWRWGTKTGKKYSFTDDPEHPVLFDDPYGYSKPIKLGYHKRPNLFLPYDLARTHWKILDARPEQLQEITREDMHREGCTIEYATYGAWEEIPNSINRQFRELWDSINPDNPWASNPWVWRYEGKKV